MRAPRHRAGWILHSRHRTCRGVGSGSSCRFRTHAAVTTSCPQRSSRARSGPTARRWARSPARHLRWPPRASPPRAPTPPLSAFSLLLDVRRGSRRWRRLPSAQPVRYLGGRGRGRGRRTRESRGRRCPGESFVTGIEISRGFERQGSHDLYEFSLRCGELLELDELPQSDGRASGPTASASTLRWRRRGSRWKTSSAARATGSGSC